MKYLRNYRNYKINENLDDNIKGEFINYISDLELWYETNDQLYEEGYRSNKDLDNEGIFHSYNLYWVSDTEDLIEDLDPLDKSIQYFIRGQFSTPDGYNQEYHVHDGYQFREVDDIEKSYFREIDDEYSITEFDEIISIDYDDWITFKDKTLDIMKKLNQ